MSKTGLPSVTFMSLFSPVKITGCEFLLYFVLFSWGGYSELFLAGSS